MALTNEVSTRDGQLAKKEALIGTLEKEIVHVGKGHSAASVGATFFQRLRRGASSKISSEVLPATARKLGARADTTPDPVPYLDAANQAVPQPPAAKV